FLNIFGLRIPLTTTAVVIALVFRATPLLIRASRAGFESIPILYEQAASSGGMNEWQCFSKIMIPMGRPAWMAGITLAFTLCLAEFGATLMFAGNIPGVSQTLPVAVMSAMESDLPLAICIAVVSMSLSILSLAGLRYVEQRWRS
ncbi:MAG: molybdate ABC transporter permease subunit, partial [Holophagaceae bacterium]